MDGMTAPERLRVLVLGMRCGFTLPVAAALIADPGVEVAGVVVPDRGPTTASGTPLDVLLWRNRIPILEAASVRKRDLAPLLGGEVLANLDAIVVACFPWRLPRWLRDPPRLGALNLHPSLLPALRGPEPEFWAIRLGLRETGVTIHVMDGGLDTGPVVLRRPVPIPAEVTLPELETLLATAGGDLIREALRGLSSGALTPRAQDGVPTYAPRPTSYDLAVSTDLPAGWAARFARAVMPVYGPLRVLIMATGQRLLVDGVIGVDERGRLSTPVEEDDETVAVRFTPGVARFRRAPD